MGFQFPRSVTISDRYASTYVTLLNWAGLTKQAAMQAIKKRFQECEKEMVFHRSQKQEDYAQQFEAEKNALAKAFPSILPPSRSPSPTKSPTLSENLSPQNPSIPLRKTVSLPAILSEEGSRKPASESKPKSRTLDTVI